jgi:hypothetical protein
MLLSCFMRNKLSASAASDIVKTMRKVFPNCTDVQRIRYDDIIKSVGSSTTHEVHYCPVCSSIFPDDPELFRCSADGCEGLRYKGPLSSQTLKSRTPRQVFVFADVNSQLRQLLEVI